MHRILGLARELILFPKIIRTFLEHSRPRKEVHACGPRLTCHELKDALGGVLRTLLANRFVLAFVFGKKKGLIKTLEVPSRKNVGVDAHQKVTKGLNEVGTRGGPMKNATQSKIFQSRTRSGLVRNTIFEHKDVQLALGSVGAPDSRAKTGRVIALGDIHKETVERNHFAVERNCDKRRHIEILERLEIRRRALDFNLASRPARIVIATTIFKGIAYRKPRGHDESKIVAKGIRILERFIDKERLWKFAFDAILGLKARVPRRKTYACIAKCLGLKRIVRIRNVSLKALQVVVRDFRLVCKMTDGVGQHLEDVHSRLHLHPKGRTLSRDGQCN